MADLPEIHTLAREHSYSVGQVMAFLHTIRPWTPTGDVVRTLDVCVSLLLDEKSRFTGDGKEPTNGDHEEE